MSSSSRRPDRPIESVALTISFKADSKTLSEVKKAIPESKAKGRTLELTIRGDEPLEVERKAREVLEKLRAASGGH